MVTFVEFKEFKVARKEESRKIKVGLFLRKKIESTRLSVFVARKDINRARLRSILARKDINRAK